MRQRNLAASTSALNEMSGGRVESQYLVGSSSPLGHSIRSHSGAGLPGWCFEATCTRTRAKREDSSSFVPSRHVILRHAFARSPMATSLTEIAREHRGGPAWEPYRAAFPGGHTNVCA